MSNLSIILLGVLYGGIILLTVTIVAALTARTFWRRYKKYKVWKKRRHLRIVK